MGNQEQAGSNAGKRERRGRDGWPSADVLCAAVLACRWRPSEANCNVPEEQWNDEFEATISMSGTDFSGLKPGDWVDTLCEHNSVSATPLAHTHAHLHWPRLHPACLPA